MSSTNLLYFVNQVIDTNNTLSRVYKFDVDPQDVMYKLNTLKWYKHIIKSSFIMFPKAMQFINQITFYVMLKLH